MKDDGSFAQLCRDIKALDNEEILNLCGALPQDRLVYEQLLKTLKPRRVRHSLGVMAAAMWMARHYGTVPEEKARLAGLLHDCGRTEANARNALGHAPAGAAIARREFGIRDEEILGAVRWHTTGRPGMTELEKIIYTADYIEPFREGIPLLEEARRTAAESLNDAVRFISESTIHYLEDRGTDIDPITRETAEYYRSLNKQ